LNECSCTFCKDCVEDYVGERTECPKCGTLAIPKNCRKNPLKASLVNSILRLEALLNLNEECLNEVEDSVQVVAKEKMKSKKGQGVSKDGNQDNCSKRKSAPVQPITNQHELRKKRRSMQM
jgi:hypothetical protein